MFVIVYYLSALMCVCVCVCVCDMAAMNATPFVLVENAFSERFKARIDRAYEYFGEQFERCHHRTRSHEQRSDDYDDVFEPIFNATHDPPPRKRISGKRQRSDSVDVDTGATASAAATGRWQTRGRCTNTGASPLPPRRVVATVRDLEATIYRTGRALGVLNDVHRPFDTGIKFLASEPHCAAQMAHFDFDVPASVPILDPIQIPVFAMSSGARAFDLVVWPGTHDTPWDEWEERNLAARRTVVTVPPYSVLFVLGSLAHAGAPNKSAAPLLRTHLYFNTRAVTVGADETVLIRGWDGGGDDGDDADDK